MTGRPPTCLCGECQKCRHRERSAAHYRSMTVDERQALVARRDREKVKVADRARYYRHREKRLAAMAERAKRYVGTPQRNARIAVGNALKNGRLTRPAECQKCARECTPHAHHTDYSKPLDVLWLCVSCHGIAHRRAA